jgi:hypothetical protein
MKKGRAAGKDGSGSRVVAEEGRVQVIRPWVVA